MDALRYFYADDWLQARPIIVPDGNGGTTYIDAPPIFRNTILDTIERVSPWRHPALTVNLGVDHTWHVPGPRVLGPYGDPPSYTGALGPIDTEFMPGSGFWPGTALPYLIPTFTQLRLGSPGADTCWEPLYGLFSFTACAGDAIEFTTNAQEVKIRLLGYTAAGQGLQAGMVEGAGIAHTDETPDPIALPTQAPDPTALLASGRVRNGCLVNIYVDRDPHDLNPVPLEIVDTWNHNPTASIYLLDGQPHTITVVHSGRHNPAFHPVSHLRPLVTTDTADPRRHNSMLTHLQATALPVGTFIRASWRAVADTGETWSLYKTPPDGVEELVAHDLPRAAHIVDLVSGVNLYVAGPPAPPLVAGDSVTFTTDVLQMGIQYIDLGWGDTIGPCSYTSAPVYVEADDVQFFLTEWFENERWGTLSLEAGNIDSDGTVRWQPAYVAACQDQVLDQDTGLPGTNVGHAGTMAAPRGQYVRWTLAAPAVAAALPYARDLSLYYWPPERDLVMVTKMPLGEDIVLGPVLNAFVGTLETFLCNTYFDAGRYVAGSTIGGATDEYLALFGQDLGMAIYEGEPPGSYRRRLGSSLSSGQDGGSMPFIAARIAELIFGAVQDPVVTSSADLTLRPPDVEHVAATCTEVVPIGPDGPEVLINRQLVARSVKVYRDPSLTPSQSYWIEMPPFSSSWPYPGLPKVPPEQVKQIVENYVLDVLNPMAAVIDLDHVSWQITWHFLGGGA